MKNNKIWYVEMLRVTAFSADTSVIETEWWEKLMPKEPPEKRLSRPKEKIYRDEGAFEKGKLILNITVPRTDWLYTAADLNKDKELPIIDQFNKIGNNFYKLIKDWLRICTPVNRLAFGAILLQPVENKEEGYNRMSQYLTHIQLDPVSSSDFLYQINRPRQSDYVDHLSVNRLSKWSVVTLRTLHFQLDSNDRTASSVSSYNGSSACRLEIDINTSQEFSGEFSEEELLKLFDELIALANEISVYGDIK